MKKYLGLMAVAIACLLACEKNPDDGTGTDPEHALTPEQEFWSVVGQLVDVDDITSDYKGKTFKPVIGSEIEPGIRVVGVNSLEAAVRRYNTLTGASIDTLTKTHSFTSKEVGSLVWTLGDGNTSWGGVEVNIQAVPTLSRIIYRSANQGDTNGGVAGGGSAYYRFGDVISRKRKDGVTEYWVCVRPAFDPEDKGKSHWISVSPLPEENIWPYNETGNPFEASNGMEYGLPTNIREDTEWSQDLAEMLFAICYPADWAFNIEAYSSTNMFGSPKGLPIFNDFHCTNIKYHNAFFWKNVQQQWKANHLMEKIFGITFDEMAAKVKQPSAGQPAGPGLHFLYKGYSWWTKTSNKPQLWDAHYSNNGTKDTQKNMHTFDPLKPCSQVVTPNNKTEGEKNYPFDVSNLTENKPYIEERRFFGDNEPRWIIRYAEGEELAENGVFNPQVALSGFQGNNQEVYRFYRDVLSGKNLTDAPEETSGNEFIVNNKPDQVLTEFSGTSHYRAGDVLRDDEGYRWIVIKPSGGGAGNVNLEKSPYTELISFEGIKFSEDRKTATNIATRQQALRLISQIWQFAQDAAKNVVVDENGRYYGDPNMPAFWNIYNTLLVEASVNVKHLCDEIDMPKYNSDVASAAETWSLAYYDPQSENQHLLRCVVQGEATKGGYLTMAYDKYPQANTTTANSYWNLTPNSFGNEYIYLQDINDQQKVSAHADDYLAKSPLTDDPNHSPRYARTETDSFSLYPERFLYNLSVWKTSLYSKGMWNERVLLVRSTALYDRGNEYATTTVDGHKIQRIANGGFPKDQNPISYEYQWLTLSQAGQNQDGRRINGAYEAIPSWQSVWGQR